MANVAPRVAVRDLDSDLQWRSATIVFSAMPDHRACSPAGLAVAAALCVGSAQAATVTTTCTFDVTGIFSNEFQGDALNEWHSLNVAPNGRLTAVGWDVSLYADTPSWLSEMTVGIYGLDDGLALRPGAGVNAAGAMDFSSGGLVDLVELGLDFEVDVGGVLWLECYEINWNDYDGDWDGIWESGTLTFAVTTTSSDVPEPASFGLAGLALLGLGLSNSRRRRRA